MGFGVRARQTLSRLFGAKKGGYRLNMSLKGFVF
jgi:hypothetical protein